MTWPLPGCSSLLSLNDYFTAAPLLLAYQVWCDIFREQGWAKCLCAVFCIRCAIPEEEDGCPVVRVFDKVKALETRHTLKEGNQFLLEYRSKFVNGYAQVKVIDDYVHQLAPFCTITQAEE
jgi:hypothetical protein